MMIFLILLNGFVHQRGISALRFRLAFLFKDSGHGTNSTLAGGFGDEGAQDIERGELLSRRH